MAFVFPFTLLVRRQQGCFLPPLAHRQDGLPHLWLLRTNEPDMKIPLSPSLLILAPMRCFSISVEILSFIHEFSFFYEFK
jgi:hypothetical protein